MVRSARSRAVYREVKEASITDLPFADRSFDAALCLFNTLGYLGSRNQREKAVSEFSRVLTDNGVLILDVMNAWHLGEGLDYRASLFALVSRWFKGLLDLRLEPGDLVFSAETTGFVHGFTRWEIERHLGSAGFLVRESRILGYDSGKHKKHFWEGQFFYVAQRTR